MSTSILQNTAERVRIIRNEFAVLIENTDVLYFLGCDNEGVDEDFG